MYSDRDLETCHYIHPKSTWPDVCGLVDHDSHFVRAKVAGLESAVLYAATFAEDAIGAVRAAVVSNPFVPLKLVDRIAEAEFARSEKEVDLCVLQALASRPDLPAETHQHLYHLGHWSVHIALAHNRACPVNILRAFASLPVEMAGINEHFRGYDQNKELREIAKEKLRLRGVVPEKHASEEEAE